MHDSAETRRRNATFARDDHRAFARDDHFGRVIAALEHMADTNCRALEALANAFGPVSPRYELDEPVVEPERSGEGGADLAQNVANVVQTVANVFGKKGADGAPPVAGGAA